MIFCLMSLYRSSNSIANIKEVANRYEFLNLVDLTTLAYGSAGARKGGGTSGSLGGDVVKFSLDQM